MKVFYHNDADGKCAANIIYRNSSGAKKATYVAMDYHMDFPFQKNSG